jgi:hypothetical protein
VLPGAASPVLVVGAQRSGTNMVVRGLDDSPEFEVYNENNSRAFDQYRLRPEPVIDDIVQRARHRFVLFKPLCDSHRVAELLDHFAASQPGQAIWIYRDFEARTRSAVAKFGDSNLRVLQDYQRGVGLDHWQVQRISSEHAEFVMSLPLASLTPESGAALFWYLRNSLFFELDLHQRPDVLLVSYGTFVADPERSDEVMTRFLRLDVRPTSAATARPTTHRGPLEIDERVAERCRALQVRLESEAHDQAARLL